VTALLVYKNESATAVSWMQDYKRRYKAKRTEVMDWLDRFCDAHGGPPKAERATWSYNDGRLTGIGWPRESDVPKGWRRKPDNRDQIVPHRGSRVGKDADKLLAQLSGPFLDDEVEKQLGMPRRAWVIEHSRSYRYGLRMEDDALWVTWGSRDCAEKLGDVAAHGWVRVPVAEYIERFGEDAL